MLGKILPSIIGLGLSSTAVYAQGIPGPTIVITHAATGFMRSTATIGTRGLLVEAGPAPSGW